MKILTTLHQQRKRNKNKNNITTSSFQIDNIYYYINKFLSFGEIIFELIKIKRDNHIYIYNYCGSFISLSFFILKLHIF